VSVLVVGIGGLVADAYGKESYDGGYEIECGVQSLREDAQ
jgi:hypothetical protein